MVDQSDKYSEHFFCLKRSKNFLIWHPLLCTIYLYIWWMIHSAPLRIRPDSHCDRKQDKFTILIAKINILLFKNLFFYFPGKWMNYVLFLNIWWLILTAPLGINKARRSLEWGCIERGNIVSLANVDKKKSDFPPSNNFLFLASLCSVQSKHHILDWSQLCILFGP